MRLISQICNVCKYSGDTLHFNISSRRWFATNGTTTVVDRLKKSDGVDPKFELIYRPPNMELLMISTAVCSVSSVLCPSMLAMFAYDSFFERNVEMVQNVSQFELAAMGTAFVSSVIGAFICTSMPLRIYGYEKDYIAILPSHIPMMRQKLHFKRGQMKYKNTERWGQNILEKIMKPGFQTASLYNVNGKRLLLTTKCFLTPLHFLEMFGNTKKHIRQLKQ